MKATTQLMITLSLLSTATSFTQMKRSFSRITKTPIPTERKVFDVSTVDAFYESQPYLAAFLTCGVKAGSADFMVQKQQASQAKEIEAENEHEFDVSRNLAFLAYGGLWQGIFQQCLYLHLYPVLFGANPTLESIACQVAFDVLITGPILCIPVSYSVKSMFASSEISLEAVERGLQNYWRDITTKGLLKTYGSIWVPAQCLTFSVVPPHFTCFIRRRCEFLLGNTPFFYFFINTADDDYNGDIFTSGNLASGISTCGSMNGTTCLQAIIERANRPALWIEDLHR